MAQKRSYPIRLKTSIVLSNLRGEASIAELARQHGIHESLIQKWKVRFLEAGEQGLQTNANSTKEKTLEAENDRLKRLLGEKELDWVRKSWSLTWQKKFVDSKHRRDHEPQARLP